MIELKVSIDIQHAMAFAGLLGLANYKTALVMFYEPNKDVERLLSHIQGKHPNFRYFSVIKAPKKVIDTLISFIKSD